MEGLIYAFLVSLVGMVNLDFNLLTKGMYIDYLKGQLSRLKIGIPLAFLIAYFQMPALVFPDLLVPIGIMLAINCFMTLFKPLGGMQNLHTQIIKGKIDTGVIKFPVIVLLIILLISVLGPIYPLFRTEALRDIPKFEESFEKLDPIDPSDIRQVPLEYAYWKADKVIGDLGYRAIVGYLTVQLVHDHLYWIAPLEFENFWKWLKYRTTPGYVMVDAQDPSKKTVRVDTANLKYIESAFFFNNLKRHVYMKFPFYRLQEFTFELDENKKPWYVISAVKPTIWFTGEKTYGVIIVDPESGVMNFYSGEAIPGWVDRVIPEVVAENYNFWFGAYVNGFWNTKFSQKDMHLPTKKFGVYDVFAIRGKKGRMVWFTGHTSPSAKDESMLGYATIDTHTGRAIYYTNISGYYNEIAVIQHANSKVSNFEGYYATQPLFYNLYGELSWVVPILSTNNIIQRIAIVHAETGNIVLGNTLEEALGLYREWMSSELGKVLAVNVEQRERLADIHYVSGYIERIKRQDGYFLLVLRDKYDYIYNAGIDVGGSELLLTEKGDQVKLGYSKTDRNIAEVYEFDNLELEFGKPETVDSENNDSLEIVDK